MARFTYEEYAAALKAAFGKGARLAVLRKIALDTGITPAQAAKLKKLAERLDEKG